MKYKQYLGILLGALYGLIYRLFCEVELFEKIYDFNIYSISFLWVVPIVVGVIPVIIAQKEIQNSKWKQFFYPFLSVLLFFIIALTSGLEDWICILIITFPFLAGAGLSGIIIAVILKNRNSKKLYSILLLPFIIGPFENILNNTHEVFRIANEIEIESSDLNIWNNIIEVPEINEEEFDPGFYNFLGVPRPVKSELTTTNGYEYRYGYFTDDLILCETISEKDSLKFVKFRINLDKSHLRDLPTDKHLLNSDYFKFENISYRVTKMTNEKCKLTLTCSYSLNSKMNSYANFWASSIIDDFENRLLLALKKKLEKKSV